MRNLSDEEIITMIEEGRTFRFPREDEVGPDSKRLTDEDVLRFVQLRSDIFLRIMVKLHLTS